MRREWHLIAALAAVFVANVPAMARPDDQDRRWQIHTPEFLKDNLRRTANDEFLLVQSEPRNTQLELADRNDGDQDATAEDLRRQAGELRQRVRELRDAGKMEEAAELIREAREQMRAKAEAVREKMQAMRSRVDQLREEGREDEIPELLRALREESREMGPGPMRARDERHRQRARGQRPPRGEAASEAPRPGEGRRRRASADDDSPRPERAAEDAERDGGRAIRGGEERRDAPPAADARRGRRGPPPRWRPGDPVGGRGPAARGAARQRGPRFADRPRARGPGSAVVDDSWPGPRPERARRGEGRRGAEPKYAGPGPGGGRHDLRGGDGLCRRCQRALSGRRGPRPDPQMRSGRFGPEPVARGPRPPAAEGFSPRTPGGPPRSAGDRMSRAPRTAQVRMAARLLRAAGFPDVAERVTRLVRDEPPPPRRPPGFPERASAREESRDARQGEHLMRQHVEEVHQHLRRLQEQVETTHRELRELHERIERLERRVDDD